MADLNALRQLVDAEFNAVNQLIVTQLDSQIGLIDSLCHHIIDSGGKRLRPVLLLLTAKAVNYTGDEPVSLAAAIEYFHTATLLHDDVIDDSTLRRGVETANEIYGTKPSILVGDYLFTQAMQLMVDVGHMPILQLMSKTAHDITCGEVNQLSNRHDPSINPQNYYSVIKAKTAILFAACTKIPALLAELPKTQADALYHYGLHLGMAFQLVDDALDYRADAETLGKNVGDDLAEGKPTLPLLYVLEQGNAEQQACVRESIKNGGIKNFAAVIEAIEQTGAIEYTIDTAQAEVEKALLCLDCLAESAYKQALVELARFSVGRSY